MTKQALQELGDHLTASLGSDIERFEIVLGEAVLRVPAPSGTCTSTSYRAGTVTRTS